MYLITIYDRWIGLRYTTLTKDEGIPRIINLLMDSDTYALESMKLIKNYEPLAKVLKYIKKDVKPHGLNY